MKDIDKATFEKERDLPGTLVIDVREAAEFADLNVGGLNVPPHLVMENAETIGQYERLIVICTNGSRSHLVAKFIERKFPKATVLHLEEGFL